MSEAFLFRACTADEWRLPVEGYYRRNTPGSRLDGRPEMTWTDNIKSSTDLSLDQLLMERRERSRGNKIVRC